MTTTNMTGAGRYKLLHLLEQKECYSAYAALDIETSTRPAVLINVYHSPESIRCMVSRYFGLENEQCRDFYRMYTEDGSFTAVFALYDGEKFDDVFVKRGGPDEEERIAYAESLLHAALERTGMPAELLAEMLRPQNIVVQKKNRCVAVNAAIAPIVQQQIYPVEALSVLLERILGRKWSVCDEQIEFLDRVKDGKFDTISALYSAWRELQAALALDKKTFFLTRIIRFIKRKVRQWLEEKKAQRLARKHALDD